MCCEDMAIYQEFLSTPATLALLSSSIQLVPANPTRQNLVVLPPQSGTAWLSVDTPAVVGTGIEVPSGIAPIVIERAKWGSIVGKQWYVIHSVGSVNMLVVDVVWPNSKVCGNGQ